MEIRRILSVCCIALVLLSAVGYEGNNLGYQTGAPATGSLLTEDFGDGFQEFRETIKISLSGSTRARSYNCIHSINRLTIAGVRHQQFRNYSSQYLTRKPAKRLFLDLGALII